MTKIIGFETMVIRTMEEGFSFSFFAGPQGSKDIYVSTDVLTECGYSYKDMVQGAVALIDYEIDEKSGRCTATRIADIVSLDGADHALLASIPMQLPNGAAKDFSEAA